MTGARAKIDKFARFATAGVAVAATAAAAVVVKSFKDVAPKIDQISKAADRLNVSTQALAGLGHAAELSGVNLETITTALTRMEQGIGEASPAFKELGLDVNQLASMGADEAFLRIADSIGKLPSVAQRTAVAMQLFGRGGANLLPMMKEGSVGIKAMMADADNLGKTFSRSQGAMVEAANDAQTRAGAAIEGLKMKLVVGLSPAVAASANAFAEWAASAGRAADGVNNLESQINPLTAASARMLDTIHELKIVWKGLGVGVLNVTSSLNNAVDAVTLRVQRLLRTAGLINETTMANLELDSASQQATSAEEIRQATKDYNAALSAKLPSERIHAIVTAAGKAAEQAKANAPAPEVKLPPNVEKMFSQLGGLLARSTQLPGKAGAALGAAAAGLAGGTRPGMTPALALTRSGSAESYRQQAAIRRQGENNKIPREQLVVQKRMAAGIDKLVQQGFGLLPANLF